MSKVLYQEKFREAHGKAEAIRMKYQGSAAEMTAEEDQQFEGFLAEAESYRAKIDREDRAEALSAYRATPVNGFDHGSEAEGGSADAQKALRKTAFRSFITGGLRSMAPEHIRALQADNPAGGGFLVAPQDFMLELLANVKNAVFIRQMAREFPLDRAESLGVPTLDGDVDDADWTTELATGNQDTGLAFGKRELKPNPLAKRVKISNKLLRQAAIDPADVVRDRLGYKFGVSEEKAFLVGTGANQPLGVFTPDANGISTNSDTVALASTTFSGDDFINVKHDLKPQYWDKAVWVLHRNVLKAVRKLKDANNNYIWASGMGPGSGLQGNPGTLVDIPYHVSEYAPSTIATGQYTAILGNFGFYWIADALDMQVQVLDQLYAENNQTGYIARKETDGMPVLEEAFRRLRMA